MYSLSCTVRILKIFPIKLSRHSIPVIKFKVELAQVRNRYYRSIIEAEIWGDLAYNLKKYYQVNDYLILDGYFLVYSLSNNKESKRKLIKLIVYQFYPYF